MKKITTVKRKANKAWVLALSFTMAVTCLFCAPIVGARAQSTDIDLSFKDFQTESFSIENNQFASSSGSYPQSPSSWQGGYGGSFTSSNLVGGVVELTSEEYFDEDAYESIKLYKYDEYADKQLPKTPFGYNTTLPNGKLYFPGTNKSVLMINTNGSETAYGYSSSDLSLKAHSFYKLSAYVKTGDFSQSQGAVIKLSGFTDESEIGFWNIDTLDDIKRNDNGYDLNSDNLYGWKQYTIFVATGYNAETVKLNLMVGDNTEEYTTPSKGYAFFDNVEAYELSATSFYTESEVAALNPARNVSFDMNVTTRLTADDGKGGKMDIGSFANGLKGWTDITEDDEGNTYGGAKKAAINALRNFAETNPPGFTSDPVTPIGKTPYGADDANNILVMYADDKVSAGLRSAPITIKRNNYYRIGIWANAAKLGDGATASMVVSGKSTIASDNYKLAPVAIDDLAVNAGNKSRYGWKEFAFYVKGSSLDDVEINVELWLGRTAKSAGIIMFDDITLQTLTYSQYSDNSSGGSVVALDAAAVDTGITNGKFTDIGDFEEYKYPMVPAEWTYHTAADVGTSGFAAQAVDTDGVASGIIPTDEAHFAANRKDYKNAPNPTSGRDPDITSVLLIGSKDIKTAVCYTSPNFTAAAASYNKLSISLQVRDIEGYGASIVLKSGTNIVDSIENITTTGNSFKTYDFYIKGAYAEKTLSVEIWLGNIDRKINRSKLSSGYVYVAEAALVTDVKEEDYNSQLSSYRSAIKTGTNVDYSVVSLSYDQLFVGDKYSPDGIGASYKWNASTADPLTQYKAGVFDPAVTTGHNEIPSYFARAYEALGKSTGNILYLRNINAGSTTVTTRESIDLTATKYYLLSFGMLIDIPDYTDNTVGVTLEVPGFDLEFENIDNTLDSVGRADEENGVEYDKIFKTYNFYVAVGNSDINSPLSITLGGKIPNQYAAGRVFVSSIDIQEITNITFEEETKDVDEDDEFIRFVSYADETTDEPENPDNPDEPDEPENPDDDNTDTQTPSNISSSWWFIPSLLFAVAIVIAIVGVTVRKLIEKRSRRKTKEKTNSYDRKHTLNKTHDETEQEAANPEIKVVKTDTVFETFDEDAEDMPFKKPESGEHIGTSPEPTDVRNDEPIKEDYKDEFDD